MIYTHGGMLPALVVVSAVVVFDVALGEEEKCKLHGKFVPCPQDLDLKTKSTPTAAPPAPPASTTLKTKGLEFDLSSMWNKKPTPTPAKAGPAPPPAPAYQAAPTPYPTAYPTPAPPPLVEVGANAMDKDKKMSKQNIGKLVGAGVGIAAALAAGGAGIGIAINNEEKEKAQQVAAAAAATTSPPPAGPPKIAAKAEVKETPPSKGKSSGGSMDRLQRVGRSFPDSSGDFTWLIILLGGLLALCVCLAVICAACRGGKKKVKKVPRSLGNMAPAMSAPSQQEQAPLLNQQVGLGGSFAPPAPGGMSAWDQANSRAGAISTETMYNGPAQTGFGGYFPSTAGTGGPNPVSPLALETAQALAPPPPPPKPPQYGQYGSSSPPGSFGQPPTYMGTGTMAGAAGLQTNPPMAPPSWQMGGAPGMQTMPPQGRPPAYGQQPPSPGMGWGYGGMPPPAAGGYSNTQMMETMPALPKQNPYAFR